MGSSQSRGIEMQRIKLGRPALKSASPWRWAAAGLLAGVSVGGLLLAVPTAELPQLQRPQSAAAEHSILPRAASAAAKTDRLAVVSSGRGDRMLPAPVVASRERAVPLPDVQQPASANKAEVAADRANAGKGHHASAQISGSTGLLAAASASRPEVAHRQVLVGKADAATPALAFSRHEYAANLSPRTPVTERSPAIARAAVGEVSSAVGGPLAPSTPPTQAPQPAAIIDTAKVAGIPLAAAAPALKPPQGTAAVSGRANFRSEPSSGARILRTLAAGTEVLLLGCKAGWCRVSSEGEQGYLAAGFFRTEPSRSRATRNRKVAAPEQLPTTAVIPPVRKEPVVLSPGAVPYPLTPAHSGR